MLKKSSTNKGNREQLVICVSGWEGSGKTYALGALPKDQVFIIPELARLHLHLDPNNQLFPLSVTNYMLSQYTVSTRVALLNGAKRIVSDRGVIDVAAFIRAFESIELPKPLLEQHINYACDLLERDHLYDEIIYIKAVSSSDEVSKIIGDGARVFSPSSEAYLANLSKWETTYFETVENTNRVCSHFTVIDNYQSYDVVAHLLKAIKDD